jgi:hypothetical protein
MIRHIVGWTLKEQAEGASRADNAKKMKSLLESLNGKIPGMHLLEVGIDFSRTEVSFDVVLYSEFASREALDAYQNHPDHVVVKDFIAKVRADRRLADYETNAPPSAAR